MKNKMKIAYSYCYFDKTLNTDWSLTLIGSTMFGAIFNLVTRVGLP